MPQSDKQKRRALWETMADEADGDIFESRRSPGRDIPETLPRLGVSSVGSLPRLTGSPGEAGGGMIDLVRLLRTGGMGEIHIANQRPLGRRVAVKRLRQDKNSQRHRLAMLNEGWITGRLQHPNIVPVYSVGQDDAGQPAIVMKLIEGVSLAEILDDFSKLPAVFTAESQLESHIDILIQVCNAIAYTHDQGVIHRDIKPANIMVGEYGEVYLLDWGIATQVGPGLRPMGDGESPRHGAEGTPAYMAPEMAAPSFADLSRRTDVFLLGACLHEMLTGEPINDGESYFDVLQCAFERKPPEYGFDVPNELARIATKALARNPRERFRTVVDFRRALRDFLNMQTSWRLAEVARSKLVVLEEKIESGQWSSRSELYPLFGACRFGFQHALEVRSNNQKARQGLQKAVELMIDWELRNSGATAAEILTNALPSPAPELEARVEAALGDREREHRESLFTKLSPDALVAVDQHGKIVYANEQTSEIFGWPAEELVGERVEVLVPTSIRDAHRGYRAEYNQAPTRRPMGSEVDLQGVRKDGSTIPVDISLAPVELDDEMVTLASIRCISRPLTASEFIEESPSLEVLNALATPVFFIHAGRVVWANSALVDALDFDSSSDSLRGTLDALFPDHADAFPTRGDVEQAGPIRLEDVTARTADGDDVSVSLRFSARADVPDAVLVEVV